MPDLPPHADMVQLRRMLDRQDVGALIAFLADHPYAATARLEGWSDHPRGTSPLAYVAMARYDTTTGVWRDVPGSASAVRALLAAGAPVDGHPDDEETPLITAASYGDADVAAALVAAGAEVDAVASDRSGGVPGGSALLHAAVFGMTDVVDVLVAAGATVRSVEEAAAAGDIAGWVDAETDEQAKIRALVMAADHQRLEVIAELVAAGTPADEPDQVFGRHPLRLAAANGRPSSVVALLRHGANPALRDAMGRTPLDHCRLGRAVVADTRGHDAVEAILEPLTPEAGRF